MYTTCKADDDTSQDYTSKEDIQKQLVIIHLRIQHNHYIIKHMLRSGRRNRFENKHTY